MNLKKTLFVPRFPYSVPDFLLYNIWQDIGIRPRIAATAARSATNELHTSLTTNITKLILILEFFFGGGQ